MVSDERHLLLMVPCLIRKLISLLPLPYILWLTLNGMLGNHLQVQILVPETR